MALLSVLGGRLFWMAPVSRAASSAPAARALPKIEIRTLCSLQRFPSKLAPEKSLTIQQAIMAVACLGGDLNRKKDWPPGATVLWRGWQRLASMSQRYESMADGWGVIVRIKPGTIPIPMTTDSGHQAASAFPLVVPCDFV